MTKEELKQEAEESFEQYKVTDEDYVVSPYSDDMGEKMLMFNYEYEVEETYLRLYTQGYLAGAEPREKRIEELESINKKISDECHKLVDSLEKEQKENAELKANNDARKFAMVMSEKVEKQLREENADLKVRIGLSIECEKAQKNGELCLGYGGDEDEPCERCKNCIKCECGYYQLGETEKDDQLTKAKEIIKTFLGFAETFGYSPSMDKFISDTEQFIKDSEVEK